MYLSKKQIESMRKWLEGISDTVQKKSHYCALFSDESRLKILLVLKQQKEVCVSDIARILGITISAVSHQLAKLESFGAVKKSKKGQSVCYSPAREGHIIKCLSDFHKSTK